MSENSKIGGMIDWENNTSVKSFYDEGEIVMSYDDMVNEMVTPSYQNNSSDNKQSYYDNYQKNQQKRKLEEELYNELINFHSTDK